MKETMTPVKLAVPPQAAEHPRARDSVAAKRVTLAERVDLLTVVLAAAQLALLVLVVKLYRIEARPFRVVFAMACCGFVVHHFLPRTLKLPFFAWLSVAAMAVALGIANAALVLGTGWVLIGLCNLPVAWGIRIA